MLLLAVGTVERREGEGLTERKNYEIAITACQWRKVLEEVNGFKRHRVLVDWSFLFFLIC